MGRVIKGRFAVGTLSFAVLLLAGCWLPSGDALGAPATLWTGCSGGGGAGQCTIPRGIGVQPTAPGHIFVGDQQNARIDEFTAWGQFVKAWGWNVAPAGVDEEQEVKVAATAGQFRLSFGAATTVDLGFDATAGEVEVALDGLSSISSGGGGVAVSGGPGGAEGVSPYIVRFDAGPLAGSDVPQLGIEDGSTPLSGGVPISVAKVSTRANGTPAASIGLEDCTTLSGCQTGATGSGAGQFGSGAPQGIAVDSAGDIYAVDFENRRVEKFDASGRFVWAIGGGVDQGPNHPGNLCMAAFVAEGDTCGAGTTGSANGQFGAWKVGSYVAAGPGDVIYVGDQERIQEFDKDGGFVKSIPLTGKTVQSLAVDGSGGIYVAFFQNGLASLENVAKLNQAGAETCSIKVHNPRAIATDATGNAYVVDGFKLGEEEMLLREFNSSCLELPNFAFESGFDSSTGIATGEACMKGGGVDLYASNSFSSNSYLRAFGPSPENPQCPPPVAAPSIADQWAASVDSEGAVVRARINPHFWADTSYLVQYGTEKCSEGGCSGEQPAFPGSELGAGVVDSDVVTSGVSLVGLAPNTTYHYRFVARSGGGGPVYGKGGEVGVEGEEGSFTTPPAPPAPGTDTCPNAGLRSGGSAVLPDCRAYEMVSPVDKEGADIMALNSVSETEPARLEQSADPGDRMTYSSFRAFGDALSAPWSSQYLATRGSAGWLNVPVSPGRTGPSFISHQIDADREFKFFSADVCSGWLLRHNEPTLSPGAPSGFPNIYESDLCGGTGYAPPLIGVEAPYKRHVPELQGLTRNGAVALVRLVEPLAVTDGPAAASSCEEVSGEVECASQLYESYEGGKLRVGSVLPGGEACEADASAGTLNQGADGRYQDVLHAISEDGSRIYWSCGELGAAKLYLRTDHATTIPVSETVSSQPARFYGAAADGTKAIFGMKVGGGEDLYEFDATAGGSTLIAGKMLGVVGISEDASRVYLVSEEGFDGAPAGEPNLYLYESGGGFAFLARLSAKDTSSNSAVPSPVSRFPVKHIARATADGLTATFISNSTALSEAVSGHDNIDLNSGEPDAEVYVYNASADEGEGELVCVSCNRTGARPVGRDIGAGIWAAAQIPGAESDLYAPRALSADGRRLFFDSFEPLARGDTNGKEDVYEWERPGKGDCVKESNSFVAAAGGCVRLISSGESPLDSEFLDADSSGANVFFATASSLLPQDPGLIDIYDARLDGGFPPPPSEPAECEGEACQSPPPPPGEVTPASSQLRGPGNVPARKGPAHHRKHKHKARKKHGRSHRRAVR